MKTVKNIARRLQGEQTPAFIYFRDLENHSQNNFGETHSLPYIAGMLYFPRQGKIGRSCPTFPFPLILA